LGNLASKYVKSYAAMIAASFLVTACGSSDVALPSGAGGTTAPPITVSGTLGGALSEFVTRPSLTCDLEETSKTGPHLFTSLAGTVVQCATLTTPPATGSATTDSNGTFSVTFNGSGVPFSCFLSTTGGTVVPLSFSNSTGTGSSSIVTSSGGSIPLGTIAVSVDSSTGAQTVTATLSSTTSVQLNTTTPPGLPCLVGLWSGQTATTCGGLTNGLPPNTRLSLNVSQLPNGTYVGALTYAGTLSQATNGLVLQTGTIPALSTCLSSTSGFAQTNLVVGMSPLDQSGGNAFPSGTTITALPGSTDATCPNGIVLSQATVNASPASGIEVEFANCNATAPAVNLTSIAYDSTESTMTIVHPAKCSVTGVAPFQSSPRITCSGGGNSYVGTLTSGSKCLTITGGGTPSLPSGLVSGDTVAENATGSMYPTVSVYRSSDTANFCTTGQIQLLTAATATGSGTITVSTAATGTAYFTGSYTSGSICVTPTALPSGVGANGDYPVSDTSLLTNSIAEFVTPTTCSSIPGALQLSSNVTVPGSGTATVMMTDGMHGSTPFWVTLTNGSPCAVPNYVGDNNRIYGGETTLTASSAFSGDTAVNYGACSSTQAQLGRPAITSGSVTITDNTNASGSFSGSSTVGSTCVTPALTNPGEIVADHNGALPSGTMVVQSDGSTCTGGQIQLSAAAGSAAATGESIAIIPTSALSTTGCYFTGSGPAFDVSGNAYWNGSGNNCGGSLTTTQQQSAYTETEVIPINSSCTSMWDTASTACLATPNSANCLGTPAPTFTSGTYVKTVTGCAACFPGASNTYDAGCVGVGNVTCTTMSGTSANQVLTKQ